MPDDEEEADVGNWGSGRELLRFGRGGCTGVEFRNTCQVDDTHRDHRRCLYPDSRRARVRRCRRRRYLEFSCEHGPGRRIAGAGVESGRVRWHAGDYAAGKRRLSAAAKPDPAEAGQELQDPSSRAHLPVSARRAHGQGLQETAASRPALPYKPRSGSRRRRVRAVPADGKDCGASGQRLHKPDYAGRGPDVLRPIAGSDERRLHRNHRDARRDLDGRALPVCEPRGRERTIWLLSAQSDAGSPGEPPGRRRHRT